MTWYEKDKDTAVIKMYADIGWWGVNASGMTNLLEQLDAKYKTVIVRMHCYGGNVFEGNAIYNVLESMKAYTIALVEGVCMSMGTVLLPAFDEVQACENATFMFHSPVTYGSGNARDMESAAKLLRTMEKNFTNAYKKKTGGKLPDFFDGTDHYYDAQGVKAMGMVDKIVEPLVADVKKLIITEDMSQVSHEDLYNKYAAYLVTDDQEEEPAPGNKRKRKPAARQVASPEASGTDLVTKPNDNTMKKLLIQAFALVGLTEASSDTAVLEAVQAKLQEKDTEISNLKTAAAAAVKAQAEGMIATAEKVAGKCFDDTTKANLLKVAETSGTEVFTAMLALATPTGAAAAPGAQQPKTPTLHTMVNSGGGKAAANSRDDWDWDTWIAKDSKGLEAMADADRPKYEALYFEAFGEKPQWV